MNSGTSKVWKISLFSGLFLATMALAPGVYAAEFQNPIASETLQDLILTISRAILQLMLVLAPLAILFTGFRFLIAATTGNQGKLGEAKKLFFWTLIGTALIVGASVIATAIINFAKGL